MSEKTLKRVCARRMRFDEQGIKRGPAYPVLERQQGRRAGIVKQRLTRRGQSVDLSGHRISSRTL